MQRDGSLAQDLWTIAQMKCAGSLLRPARTTAGAPQAAQVLFSKSFLTPQASFLLSFPSLLEVDNPPLVEENDLSRCYFPLP